jgi:phage-related minor tail protein
MSLDKTIINKSQRLNEIQNKLKKFSDLLNDLSTSDNKLKALWLEIYENAVLDRCNAERLYDDLYVELKQNPSNHAIYGTQVAKYLERMCRSNQQLLNLAEMIAKQQEKESTIDTASLLDSIENSR